MSRLAHYTALSVGVLLLVAPAAWACGELAAMTAQCPMSKMAESMGTSACHDGGQMPEDCCELSSAPEPMQALSGESVELLTALQVADLQGVVPPAPAAPAVHPRSADASRPPDLGRYTLFSSFLL